MIKRLGKVAAIILLILLIICTFAMLPLICVIDVIIWVVGGRDILLNLVCSAIYEVMTRTDSD